MILRRRFKFMMGLAAALFLSLGVYGCHRHKSPEDRAAYVKEKIVDKLDFNSDQSKLLDELSEYLLAWEKDSRQQREDDRLFARNQVSAAEIDTAAVIAIYERKRQELDKRVPEIVEKIAALHRTLNAEQKQELAEFLEKFEKRRRHW